MSAKEIAVIAGCVATVAGLGWLTKRAIHKAVAKKAITPELVATAQKAMELKTTRELIEALRKVAIAKKEAEAAKSPLEKSFDKFFDYCDNVLEFNPAWKNGTGYFNGAMTVELPEGEMAISMGDCKRRILMIGTANGTAVFFERYTLGHGPFVVVHNTPNHIRATVPGGNLDNAQFTLAVSSLSK